MQITKADIDILKFYEESGVDESYGVEPHDFFSDNSSIFVKETSPTNAGVKMDISILKAKQEAEKLLEKVSTLSELQNCVSKFSLNPLSKFASNAIYGCGVENPDLLIITEMPNADEDYIETKLREVVRHEFRHHMENLGGMYGRDSLEHEDKEELRAYLRR